MFSKKYLTKIIKEFTLFENNIVNLTNDSRDRYYTRKSYKLNFSHLCPKQKQSPEVFCKKRCS